MKLGLLSAGWVAGVLLGHWWGLDSAVALLLAAGVALLVPALRMARVPVLPSVLVVLLLLGAWRAGLDDVHESPAGVLGQDVVASGTIVSDPESASRQVRFELQVSSVRLADEWREVDLRWLVYANPSDELVSRRASPYFRYGDELTVRGRPLRPEPFEGFDYAAYLSARGITATMFAQEPEVTGEGGAWWRSAIFAVRGRLADSIERAMPYPESALASAVLLGKREALPADLVEKFRGTGAAHLLAISGLHVGVLLAVTAGSAAWLLGRQRPTYLIVAGAVIWLYALLAGAPPSAMRAAAMGTVYLAALGVGRPSSALPALALAAAVMTAFSPGLVRQVSFQLSFAAVAGIAVALAVTGGGVAWRSTPSAGWAKRLLGWALSLVLISAAATLATWPLVAVNFGQVALMSVPVSLLTIPAMAPLIVSALAASVGGLVFPPFGVLLGWVASAPAAWVTGVVSVFPTWTVQAEGVGGPVLLFWYGGIVLALLGAQPHRMRRWRRSMSGLATRFMEFLSRRLSGTGAAGTGRLPPSPYITVAAAVGLGIAAAILWARVAGGPDGYLHVHFLDIGQGDSILVVTPSGRQALIDGGPDGDAVSQALAEALPGGDRSLDLVVMTHLDSDHSGGLLEVLDRFAVGAVLTGPSPAGGAMQAQWEERLKGYGKDTVEVYAGYAIELDEDIRVEVLNPSRDRSLGNSNNDSVVLRLSYGDVSVLLTADIESEAEARLVARGAELESTVLKVGHHGSATSTSQVFLGAVSPSIAVVSAGMDNPYGHPASEVIKRLEDEVGAGNVYRTDLQGDVEVVSDGEDVWVRTQR